MLKVDLEHWKVVLVRIQFKKGSAGRVYDRKAVHIVAIFLGADDCRIHG